MSRTAWRATSISTSLVIEAGSPTSPASTMRVVDGLAAAQRVAFERLCRRLGKTARDRRRAHRIHVVEEERDRHIQDAAQLMQPAGADTVGAALVFLHLLKGQTDGRAELFLREPE